MEKDEEYPLGRHTVRVTVMFIWFTVVYSLAALHS
jgi:hypothetical protein